MKFAVMAVAAVTVALCPLQSSAEPGPIGNWLMSQPVTLWDRGMDAINDEARDMYDVESEEWLLGAPVELWAAWAGYHWDNNEIEISALFRDVQDNIFIDHEWCNYVRRRVIEQVLGIATLSGMDEAATESWMDIATQIIDQWFSHDGFRRDRDEDLGAKLARIIFVKVKLQPVDGSGIECRDRITSLDAPSKPSGQ